MHPRSALGSPTPSAASRLSDSSRSDSSSRHFARKSSSVSEFEIERTLKLSNSSPKRPGLRRHQSEYGAESALRASVSRLFAAKARPFTVNGRIPMDPASLVLFFRSKSGITHSLDYPIDVDYDTPPALEVLIAACKPHPTPGYDVYPDREALFYPANLPLTATLEIANHPILDAVRNALFPALHMGHYLTALRDKLEVMVTGSRMAPQSRTLRNDGRVATICVTLPVHYRGGTMIVRDAEGAEEKFFGGGGKPGEVHWTAFLGECEYEVETIQQGCRMSITYAVHLKTYGAAVDPLITPSEHFLDLLSPVLSLSRGRKVAFYLSQDYGVNPSEGLAESLVPHLKGSDSLLYHALKVYKLAPELHWAAGGYVWPIDRTVECGNDLLDSPTSLSMGFPSAFGSPARSAKSIRGPMSYYGDLEEDDVQMMKIEADSLRMRVEESGAIPLSEAEIFILSDRVPGPMAKERVHFVSNGELEKLIVNVLLVIYVP
ncbi:uncharacterized protein EDB91DRAFT_790254 [Suillus paluster]|uniref:uncharacterized protein n=1 Tax=Suillus paluster TaxID=48578 RepID=UPI001B85CE27|nr:uncharacterized protein EDB91DRAFT_790254 [Suillus paluster]KAG1730275.1 hypothetical protein EDB91DRAFT_790254 [Suillus paluster]